MNHLLALAALQNRIAEEKRAKSGPMSHDMSPVELIDQAKKKSLEDKEERDSHTESRYFIRLGMSKRTANVLASHIGRAGFRYLCDREGIRLAVRILDNIGPKRAAEVEKVSCDHFCRNFEFFRGRQNRERYADDTLHWP